MAKYNGHRSWNAWNVSLWISNDEGLYRRAVELVRQWGVRKGASWLMNELPERTPDGAVYNWACVLEAVRGLEVDRG